jgi:thioredoxin-dependent peroxiredoxin
MGLDGKPVEFKQLTAKKTVVLVVLRGWPGYDCPYCTIQVHDYVANAADLAKQDVQVLMVYPGPADKLKDHAEAFLKDKNWPKDFLFVLDPDYAFTNAYGLRWNAPSETAYPSTFIVNCDNTVLFEQVSKSHGGRVAVATVITDLEKLNGESTAAMSTPTPMMTPAPETSMSAPMATPAPAMSTPSPMMTPASGMNASAPMAAPTATTAP